MILHDVAITEDQHRMLCVATLTASPDGFKPSMSREEKQIIGQFKPPHTNADKLKYMFR